MNEAVMRMASPRAGRDDLATLNGNDERCQPQLLHDQVAYRRLQEKGCKGPLSFAESVPKSIG